MHVETVTPCEATDNRDPLLNAKLRSTAIRSRLTARRRLFDLLDKSIDGPLTIVNGPAGMGKTALVSTWIEAAPGHVSWLSLEAGDERPEVFWTYVVACLTLGDAESTAGRRPEPPESLDGDCVARLCEVLTARAEPSVLVLDNIELIGPGEVADGLDFLIRHAGPQLRVLALGRGAPALPLHRYRLAGWVTEIGPADLAFTTSEAGALLAAHGVTLPAGGVRLLTERTEGWAAGLRLAALALHGKSAGDAERIVRGFGGERPDIAEYFTAEVLDHQPADLREFLLTSSVADELSPELAAALSGRGDAAQVLRSLANAQAFVTESDTGRYRYHPLFRDTLRTRIRHDLSDRVPQLHRDAAHLLLDDGQPIAAARQAALAGDWAHASSLVVEHLAIGRLMVGNDKGRLGEMFEHMPVETDGAAPSVVRAAMAVAANQEQAGAYHLSRANTRDAGGSLAICLAIATLRAVVASAGLEVDRTVSAAATAAGLSAKLADAGRPVPPDLLATVLTAKGAMLLWSGQLNGSEDSLTEALRAAEAAGLHHLRIQIMGEIALLNAIHGRLRRASRSACSASQLADRLGLADKDRPAVIDAAFAWIHTERWDVDAARRHVRSVNARDDPLAVAVLSAVRDRRGPGPGLLSTSASPDLPRPPWLTQGGTGADLTVAQRSMPTLAGRVDGWLRTAAEQLDLGRSELATRSLDRALTLAAPENLRRPIVQAPLRLRRLIRQNPELTRRHGWLGPDATGIPNDDRSTPTLVEPLTNREREVLHHLAALLSTEEIAQAMFVSVNTVKTHIRGVLRKLSAARRNDAIRRAREIGLL